MGEGMTEAQLAALTQQTVGVAYLLVGLAGLFLYLAHIGDDGLRRWERLRDHFFTVKGSVGAAADYVEDDAADGAPFLTSAASRQEAEAEASRGSETEARVPALLITQKALQARLDEARAAGYDQGAVEVFAALLKAGYLEQAVKARELTRVKMLVFGVSGGRQLQALNAAIDAVDVPQSEDPPAEDPPAEPRRIPIAGGREGYVELPPRDDAPAAAR